MMPNAASNKLLNAFNSPNNADTSAQKLTWAVVLLCFITLFLFLGDTLFNTRGEPREAVVALSMLKDGNWVLPINNGVDMAYKPPFFHWLVALCSLPIGHVTEYTARMPSALALTLMTVCGFRFYAHRTTVPSAVVMVLITLTSFEVHRAAVACRVDMVLACMMVLALYALYRWTERDFKGLPVWSVLCLSGAFLTKGPVGAALPVLVITLYAWVKGMGFWRVLWRMALVGVASCVLPAVWYVAAYNEGGEKFFALVYEENILRLLGKMTYASHINPWHYNVQTVVTGFLPYTLLVLMALFVLPYKRLAAQCGAPRQWFGRFKCYIREMDSVRLFTLLSLVIIFVFYCIPKSKRSVYLLPVYPFIAYFLADFFLWLRTRHYGVVKAFGWVMTSISLLLTLVFVALKLGLVPASIMGHGHHAAENLAMFEALRSAPISFTYVVVLLVQLYIAVQFIRKRKSAALMNSLLVVWSIFLALDGIYQPLVLNTKSDKPVAEDIARLQPTGRIYSFRTDITVGNEMHPFTINFYLNDRVAPFEAFHPEKGYLIVGNDEIDAFKQRFPNYTVALTRDYNRRSCDDHKQLKLYRFEKN